MRITESRIRSIIKEEVHRILRESGGDSDFDREVATVMALSLGHYLPDLRARAEAQAKLRRLTNWDDPLIVRIAGRMLRFVDEVEMAREELDGEEFSPVYFHATLRKILQQEGLNDVAEMIDPEAPLRKLGWQLLPQLSWAIGKAYSFAKAASWGASDSEMLTHARDFDAAMQKLEGHREEIRTFMRLREALANFVKFLKDPELEDYREQLIMLINRELDDVLQAAELADNMVG